MESMNFISSLPIRSREMKSSSRDYVVSQKLEHIDLAWPMQILTAGGPTSRTRNPAFLWLSYFPVSQGICKWGKDCRTNHETRARMDRFSYVPNIFRLVGTAVEN